MPLTQVTIKTRQYKVDYLVFNCTFTKEQLIQAMINHFMIQIVRISNNTDTSALDIETNIIPDNVQKDILRFTQLDANTFIYCHYHNFSNFVISHTPRPLDLIIYKV